jgi:divalent metal cation (Fe/Co/Zn/Cd) transporter
MSWWRAFARLSAAHIPRNRLFGLILATLSLLVLPWLGRRKLLVSVALVSGALRGDGILTIAAAALAAVTLVALLANATLGWW